jgi:hypothetical protein
LRGIRLAEVNALQFSRSHEVFATLGWALYRTGRPDQAGEKLRAAVTGVRTTADIAYFLARVMADKGQIEVPDICLEGRGGKTKCATA